MQFSRNEANLGLARGGPPGEFENEPNSGARGGDGQFWGNEPNFGVRRRRGKFDGMKPIPA